MMDCAIHLFALTTLYSRPFAFWMMAFALQALPIILDLDLPFDWMFCSSLKAQNVRHNGGCCLAVGL